MSTIQFGMLTILIVVIGGLNMLVTKSWGQAIEKRLDDKR